MSKTSNQRPAEPLAPATQPCYTSFPPLPMDDPKTAAEAKKQRDAQVAEQVHRDALQHLEDAWRLQELARD